MRGFGALSSAVGGGELGIEPADTMWPGSFLPRYHLSDSGLTATEGPIRMAFRGPRKQHLQIEDSSLHPVKPVLGTLGGSERQVSFILPTCQKSC